MAVIRARINRLAGAALTRYDALRERAGGGDEEALQSRKQTGESAIQQIIEAEARRCVCR